ncbi:D-alanyl-D-alanine carboxypeptidase family protein [Peptostreptococcus faecalis]|uniref:D-alanyl-D-alanine carboxypeptidase family protein n=1 Tax=Peptostreptococcus faecalis TaxID=2045015 RepID=UPI0015E09C4C|nr:D-alanyl-D-alanine carboxypeptidase family protein [Peptostreptococcus faecalis]
MFKKLKTKKIKKIAAVCLSIFFLMPSVTSVNAQRYNDSYSVSSVISDMKTGRIVYQKNPDKKVAMASLTKMMTLLVTFDAIKNKQVGKDDTVSILSTDVDRNGTNMLLEQGDSVTLGNLMDGMMIVSANDAALAIAHHVGGDYNKFVEMMNEKAKEIGMENTIFYNSNGLPLSDEKEKTSVENTTTARDVLILSKWLYENYPKETTEITDKMKFVYPQKNIDKENTNPLLPLIGEVDGLKTGFTPQAGYCLAYSMSVDKTNGNDGKNRLIGVSMGAPSKEDRKKISFEALKYISENYKTKNIAPSGNSVVCTNINGIEGLKVNLTTEKDLYAIKKNTEKFTYEVKFKKMSIIDSEDGSLGHLEVKDSFGNIVAESNLYADVPISDMPFEKRVIITFTSIYNFFTGNNENTNEYPIITL